MTGFVVQGHIWALDNVWCIVLHFWVLLSDRFIQLKYFISFYKIVVFAFIFEVPCLVIRNSCELVGQMGAIWFLDHKMHPLFHISDWIIFQ